MMPLNFSAADATGASEEWGFNCGPAALCAVTGFTPARIRPFLPGFEEKRYTNPTMMKAALKSLGLPFTRVFEGSVESDRQRCVWPVFGLVRVQWAGPWTRQGVPVKARYRHTHWVAYRAWDDCIFDVNAINYGGWMSRDEWENDLIPWLLRRVEPQADGLWWPTHCWDVACIKRSKS